MTSKNAFYSLDFGLAGVYAAVVAVRFKSLLQYRAAALAGITTQIFWGCIKLMVLGAFYAVAVNQPPMSFQAVVAYVWLGQVLIGLLPWNHDPELQDLFTTGGVAYELLRPLDLYWFWFARTLAFRMAPTLLRMVPGVLFAVLLLPILGLPEWALKPPPSVEHALMFMVSFCAMVMLSCSVSILIAISMFWLIEARGIATFMYGIVPVFSGMIVPLPLFPDWMQGFLYWQPFRGLCDVPFRIYSGDIPISEAWLEITMQFGWAVLLILFGYTVISHARRRLEVQGG